MLHLLLLFYLGTKQPDDQQTVCSLYFIYRYILVIGFTPSSFHSFLVILQLFFLHRDGTTDITRTVHFGEPTPEEKMCFTRVLKGFIALVTSVFPRKTEVSDG